MKKFAVFIQTNFNTSFLNTLKGILVKIVHFSERLMFGFYLMYNCYKYKAANNFNLFFLPKINIFINNAAIKLTLLL